MVALDVESIDYTRYSNRQLAAVPVAVILIALVVIGGWFVVTGSPVNQGIEFTGGTEIHVVAPGGPDAIRATFDEDIASVRPIATDADAYIVTFQITDIESSRVDELQAAAEDAGFTVRSVQSTTPTFASRTQSLALFGVVAAFIGMSLVVFLLFRTFIPSIAVVLSAFGDIVIPIAIMNLTGIQLSIGTVAALLMLIGYSVDSDILLNNHVLRRSGDFYESAYRAMRTGVTMTLTSISAAIVMTVVSFLFGIQLLTAIGIVLAIGLATDLMNTYLLNLSLLRWYRGLDA